MNAHAPSLRFKTLGQAVPADGIMAMLLDSHVVDCGSSPGPGGLNSCQAHVHACSRSQEENGGEGIVAWPSPLGGGLISHFLSLCLSLSFWRAHAPYSKNTSQKNK